MNYNILQGNTLSSFVWKGSLVVVEFSLLFLTTWACKFIITTGRCYFFCKTAIKISSGQPAQLQSHARSILPRGIYCFDASDGKLCCRILLVDDVILCARKETNQSFWCTAFNPAYNRASYTTNRVGMTVGIGVISCFVLE